MGGMAQEMNALKQHVKERREAKATFNIDALQAMGISAREQSKNVFRIDTEHGAVMYYPPSNKWQQRGRLYRGDVSAFKDWLVKNRYI